MCLLHYNFLHRSEDSTEKEYLFWKELWKKNISKKGFTLLMKSEPYAKSKSGG